MAAATGYLAKGTRFWYSSDGVTYTELADVEDIGPVGSPERPDVDFTPLNPSDSSRGFKPGLKVNGELSFKQFFTKARFTVLKTLFDNGTSTYWRVTYPDHATPASASRHIFQGYVSKLTDSAKSDPDDPLMIEAVVKITTDISFTEAS